MGVCNEPHKKDNESSKEKPKVRFSNPNQSGSLYDKQNFQRSTKKRLTVSK